MPARRGANSSISTANAARTAIGGRALFYGFNGENMIFKNPAMFGKTIDNSIGDLWFGGYQCDVGPELGGVPAHKALWQGWHEWVARRNAVKTTSPTDPLLGAQLEKEFFVAPDNGDVGLTQRLINTGPKDITFCLWDRTLCVGGGFALVPLNKKSRFKNGWSLYIKGEAGKGDGKDHYDGNQPAPPGVQVLKLMDEDVVPVCSPTVLGKAAARDLGRAWQPVAPEVLARLPLLQQSTRP